MADASYSVQLTRPAERDLGRLKSSMQEAVDALRALYTNPEAGEALSANLRGARSLHWRVARVEYRAAYVVLVEEKVCVVFQVGTRENFYREAARRWASVQKAIERGDLPYPPEDSGEEETAAEP